MRIDYIQYSELLKRQQHINRLGKQGFKLLYKKNKFKLCCGVGCLVIAIIPNGVGILFYPLGFYLLGISTTDLFLYKNKLRKRIKRFLK